MRLADQVQILPQRWVLAAWPRWAAARLCETECRRGEIVTAATRDLCLQLIRHLRGVLTAFEKWVLEQTAEGETHEKQSS